MRFLYININYNTLIFVYFMKKYEEPKLKLHELKTGKLMNLSRADTVTPTADPQDEPVVENNGIKDFQVVNSSSIW